MFYHPRRQLAFSVHGVGFTTTGSKRELDFLKAELEKRYALTKGGRLGPGQNDSEEESLGHGHGQIQFMTEIRLLSCAVVLLSCPLAVRPSQYSQAL